MPDITIHINTDNLTPDELDKLHQDITRIKQGQIKFTRAILHLLGSLDGIVRGLDVMPIALSSAIQGLETSPIALSNAIQGLETSPIALSNAIQGLDTSPIALSNAIQGLDTSAVPLSSARRGLDALSIQQQQQTTVLEQQIPVLESVEQVKRSVMVLPQHNLPSREGLTEHITPTFTEVTQRQPTQHRTDITRLQRSIINTISNVPNDLLSATYQSLITIPVQTREALMLLKVETQQDIAEINDSAVLSAQEKAARIEQIERNAAQRRKQIEAEANQAKIASFNKVVANFVRGIGRMIAEQVKLRIASQILGAQQAVVPFFATHPVLSIGAAALFSSSFDDPINDALAQQAGIRQAQQRATALGRRSAIDLKQNFELGFVRETERQISSPQRVENPTPIVKNEVKLIIGGQELKAIYEETQRQIATGIISV